MIGGEGIGFLAVGEAGDELSTPLVFEPVSRVMAGGFSSGRPAEVAVLGVDLLWDTEEDYIAWDSDENIGWEA